jgi:hypothetical protein
MTLKLPTSFRGIDGKEAYERIVNAKEDTPKQKKAIPPSKPDQDGFIYVPSIQLYVSKERVHLGKNWFECHKLLNKEGLRMPTIPEFVEFLKYLKSSNNREYTKICNEITEVRKPWRGEWLDADFKVVNEEICINYYHVLDSNRTLIPKDSEILDKNTLMEDKTPGISLEDYLDNNHTSQGLPSKNVKSGDLYYWCPRSDNNSVAGFDAGSGGAILRCGRWVPSGRDSNLGVRAVRRE